MLPRKLKARIAESHALRLRASSGIPNTHPANPYDAATRLGIDVRFLDLPSVEGVYLPHAGPQILISSLRPSGRQSFTCAHELGHHQLQHGEKLDELIEARRIDRINDLDEFQADTFASFFLMPRAAVLNAFHARGWRIDAALPEHFYQVAQWIGVGNSTLIGHVSRQLKLLDWPKADELMRKSLKSVRGSILSYPNHGNIFVVDKCWAGRTVDCDIGDLLVLQADAKFNGVTLSVGERRADDIVAVASENGSTAVHFDDEKYMVTVRVSRKGYVGRYIYKYLEEQPVED